MKVHFTTLHKCWQQRGKILARTDEVSVRERESQWPDFEKMLVEWVDEFTYANGVISGAQLHQRAMEAKVELERLGKGHLVENFTASVGWMGRFSRRFGVNNRPRVGELGEANRAGIEEAREVLPHLLSTLGVQLEDLYNFDETRLWFTAQPSRTYTRQKKQVGVKKHTQRLTLALCCNASGTYKMIPLLIGKAAKPRCFDSHFNSSHYVQYRSQANVWMETAIFDEFILGMNRFGQMRGRQLVLLVDNAKCHDLLPGRMVDSWPERPTWKSVMMERMEGLRTWRLSNLRVVFLPPNTTAEIQPLDQGIICTVKARYRQRLLRWLLAESNKPANKGKLISQLRPTVRDAIRWVAGI